MKELMDEDACGIFGPENKYAIRITRIGVSAVNVARCDVLAVRGKFTERRMRQ